MRIAFVTELFSPSIGGQEVRYLQLAQHLLGRGHSVSVYTIRCSPSLPALEVLDKIAIHRVVDGFHYQRDGRMSRNPVDIMKFTLRMLELRKVLLGFDSVVFNVWPVLTPLVVPRLVPARSIVDWCEIRTTRGWDTIYRLMANPRILHTAVSDGVAGHLKRSYGIPAERVRTIVSGVETAQYRGERDVKRDGMVLYLGRLSAHKNPQMLLEAFLSAGLHRKGYSLHFAGGGPLLTEIRRQADGVENIFVYGEVEESDKIRLLKEAALLVLPSRREGFPRVVAEAAAAGTPTLTVAYRDNGTSAVVTQYGVGWVCAPDPSQLATFVERHARLSPEGIALSAHCARVAEERFDWEPVTAEFLGFLGSDE